VLGHDLSVPDDLVDSVGQRDVAWATGDLTGDGIQSLLPAIGAHPLDAVIAAHGVDGSDPLPALTPDRITRVMRINTTSVIALHAALRERLRTSGGAFVAIASQAGLRAEPHNAAYSASKFALVGWARAASTPTDVPVRVLCPGCTDTSLFRSAQARFAAAAGETPSAFAQRRAQSIPLGRLADVAETAAAAVYLALGAIRPNLLAFTGGEVAW
jgi:3-oxoacyl-[acyl-carrier protein] reductase